MISEKPSGVQGSPSSSQRLISLSPSLIAISPPPPSHEPTIPATLSLSQCHYQFQKGLGCGVPVPHTCLSPK